MRIFISILLCAASISLATFAEDKKTLVILGDSLTEGLGVSRSNAFPAVLQKKIDKAGKKWKVVNAGVSGSTTASAPARVQWLLKQKPAMILIALGANDGLRGGSAAAMVEHLDKAVALAQNAGVQVMLAGMKLPPNYGAEYRQEFEAAFKTVADKRGIPFLPFLLDKVGGDAKLNLVDGIHPNEKGHEVMAETVYQFIQKSL